MIEQLLQTPLHDLHKASDAKMAPFAGYNMPVQYPLGIMKEHNWTRENAGIFDVSHMGQFILQGADAANILSYLTPTSFQNIPLGKSTYTVLTNATGGILDDLIVSKLDENTFFIVVNAACKKEDEAHLRKHLKAGTTLTEHPNKGLIALQGPKAEEALQEFMNINLSDISSMHMVAAEVYDSPVLISRSGYTGSDGFEISLTEGTAIKLWQKLLNDPLVEPIGLGARDSLRLEAGFPLYGHDLTTETSPVEGTIKWIISEGHTNFIGAERILKEASTKPQKQRRGLKLLEKGIAREGVEIYNKEEELIGYVTSGGFCPSLKQAIAQGYVQQNHSTFGEKVWLNIRGKKVAAEVCKLSFFNK